MAQQEEKRMQVRIKLNPTAAAIPREIPVGTRLEDLAKEYQQGCPYRILAANIGSSIYELTKPVVAEEADKDITFLDMRDENANRIYQRSVSFIYLKAVYDVLGNHVSVNLGNSLNKGIYTTISGRPPVTAAEVKAVEARMHEIAEQDIPLFRLRMTKKEALDVLAKGDYEAKIHMIEGLPEDARVTLYNLDGLVNFFYGPMVPSTGYIQHFELRSYRGGVLVRFPMPKKPNEVPPYEDQRVLFNAFDEEKNWGDILGIHYVSELRKACEEGRINEIIQISEALHEKKIAQIADQIKQQKKRIILIAGPSSSGKTTFARRLCIQLKVNGMNPLYMGTDDYFVERESAPIGPDGKPNFEDLECVDLDLFSKQMNALLAGEEVDLPTYNFLTGKKEYGKRITKIQPNQPIVIEGIHGLNERLTEGIPYAQKFKIYISPLTALAIDNHNRIPTTDARMLRRIVRDNRMRGRNAAKTIEDWPSVRKGEDKNIFPYCGEADAFFNSSHIYELAFLKHYALPLLEQITKDQPEHATAKRMISFLKFFPEVSDDAVIVNNSILREFIGGSIFETSD